jgi:hypothetical protein
LLARSETTATNELAATNHLLHDANATIAASVEDEGNGSGNALELSRSANTLVSASLQKTETALFTLKLALLLLDGVASLAKSTADSATNTTSLLAMLLVASLDLSDKVRHATGSTLVHGLARSKTSLNLALLGGAGLK